MHVHLSEIEILIIENIIAMETRNCINGRKIVSARGWGDISFIRLFR